MVFPRADFTSESLQIDPKSDNKVDKDKVVFSCNECEKEYTIKASLKVHKRYVHSSERSFKCTACPKAYKSNVELRDHERTHTDIYDFSCDICAKQFQFRKTLKVHMSTHLTDEEKTHICTMCGYKFGRIQHLKNHMQTHSLNPNFYCDECGAGFKTKEQSRQHSKKHHESVCNEK